MSFIEHTSCDKCGSSDGRAVYQGGSSWCFVCHTYTRGQLFYETKKKEAKSLPTDLSQHYPQEVIDWISKYEITVEDLIRENISYNQRKRQLFFIWKDDEGHILGWQSRNFGDGPKYISSGDLDGILPIYFPREVISRTEEQSTNQRWIGESSFRSCVLTEDCLSALKVAKTAQVASMPCLTSSLSTSKLKRLASQFDTFLVWLDGNMFHNAQEMAKKLQLMGCEARAIWTPLDPKCYSECNIRNILLTGKLL